MMRIPITAEGYIRLQEEIRLLKTVERPAIIAMIAEARGHGDLKENAEYHAAKERQAFVEGRIAELEGIFTHAEVIDIAKLNVQHVVFGATVTLIDEDTEQQITYQIVGDYEADLNVGRIAISAPIARALIGKKPGDSVEVFTPRGER